MRIIPLAIGIAFLLLFGFAVMVHAQEDITPPSLASVKFEPEVIDTSDGPATITATIHVTDDLSGVGDVTLYFRKAGTTQVGMIEFREDEFYGRLIEGDNLDGYWQGRMTLPRYSAFGTWELYYVGMQDNVGNRTVIQKSDDNQDDKAWPKLFNSFVFAVGQADVPVPQDRRLFMPLLSNK